MTNNLFYKSLQNNRLSQILFQLPSPLSIFGEYESTFEFDFRKDFMSSEIGIKMHNAYM